LGQPHRTPELARRHVDQYQAHGPAAKPVFRLCRPPGRHRNFMAVVTAHPRAMHSNFATMETDLSLGPAPAVADAASATIMRRAGELLPRKAFVRWLRSRPSDRSAQRSCPHLAKPSRGWARARAMKAW